MAGEAPGDRMRSIREERGEKQPEFAVALTKAAKRLGLDVTYEGSKVSRLESGRQEFSLDDVEVIAALDRQQRGRDWLGWANRSPRAEERLPPMRQIGMKRLPEPVEDVKPAAK